MPLELWMKLVNLKNNAKSEKFSAACQLVIFRCSSMLVRCLNGPAECQLPAYTFFFYSLLLKIFFKREPTKNKNAAFVFGDAKLFYILYKMAAKQNSNRTSFKGKLILEYNNVI
jgi:hypothetical protein